MMPAKRRDVEGSWGAIQEKSFGEVLENMTLMRADRARGGGGAFTRRAACPPPAATPRLPSQVSGDDEDDSVRGWDACGSPEGDAHHKYLGFDEDGPPGP